MSSSSNCSSPENARFEEHNQTTQLQAETEDQTDTSVKPLELPLTSCQNLEKLDHSDIRDACRIDRKVPKLCFMCDKPANPVYQCKSCGAAQYCSWECNVDDAQHHRHICAQWPSFFNPPSKSTARVLIFPAQSTTPVFAWAEIVHVEDESSPRLLLRHPELLPFTDLLNPGGVGATTRQIARMGCINECRALALPQPKPMPIPNPNGQTNAFSKSPFGHGLFVLEWLPGATTDLSMDWINRSIQHITSLSGLKPGHTWLWTGPIIILSLDVSKTFTSGDTSILDHITMRDVRHAVDFFSLNLRNPAVPPLPSFESAPAPPLSLPNTTNRFPFPIMHGIKVNEIHTPIARALGIADLVEQVPVSRDLPPSNRALQGVSALAEALGLAWVVRVVLCHGEELDWLSQGLYSDPRPSGRGTRPQADGDRPDTETQTAKGSVIPAVINEVYTAVRSSSIPHKKLLPHSGDGVIFLSAGGEPLLKEHVQALLAFVKEHRIQPDDRRTRTLNPDSFKLFWSQFKAREGIGADVPSPYDIRPVLCDLMPGDTFTICKDVFRLFVRRIPNVVMDSNGVCTFKKRPKPTLKVVTSCECVR
jgi:hypothetical protein